MRPGAWQWEAIGAPAGGAVVGLAVSPRFAQDGTCFAATMAGLYRSLDGGGSWRRVGSGYDERSLTAVAVSPAYAAGGVVLAASLETGLRRLIGDTWAAGDFGGRRVRIAALAMSPAMAGDGTCFAGTMEDGVFRSRDQGAHWESCNFGLLDLEVLALAISPQYVADETVFAATTGGIFRSQNGGRAWREMAFPEESGPVLCMAISPHFESDGTLFAGTEGAGLYRSADHGATWSPVHALPAGMCINGIACSPDFAADRTALLVTESALYLSHDGGERWSCCSDAPGGLCLALAPTFPEGGPLFVGCSREGVYRASAGDLTRWQAANDGLAGRLLTGLVLAPGFPGDRRVVAYGAGEGVLRSEDGGQSWIEADDGLPSQHVSAMVSGRMPDDEPCLFAALPEGIWRSPLGGGTWEQVCDLPANLLAISQMDGSDPLMAAAAHDGRLWVAEGALQRWTPVDVPWQCQQIVAIALPPPGDCAGWLFVATLTPESNQVIIWQRTPAGAWEAVLTEEGVGSAAIAFPPGTPWSGMWYAALGDQLFELKATPSAERDGVRPSTEHVPADARPAIRDLTVVQGSHQEDLLAITTRGLYFRAGNSREWQPVDHGTVPRPIVAARPSPGFGRDGCYYALEMGGVLWRVLPGRAAGLPGHGA